MGEEAAREIVSGGRLLHGGGKGGHRPVVYVAHRAARTREGAQALGKAGDPAKLRFVVKRGVFAHALRLGRFAADDAVADDHVREAEADGIEVPQALAQQRLHLHAGGAHGVFVRPPVKGGLKARGNASKGALTASSGARQPREQQQRLNELFGAREGGGVPVVFLEGAERAIDAGGELDVRAAHVHAHQHAPGHASGQRGEHRRFRGRAGRVIGCRGQRGDVARFDGKSRLRAAQGRERALVHVQALAVPRAMPSGNAHLKHLRQSLHNRRHLRVGGVETDLDPPRAQRRKAVVEHGVEKGSAKDALLSSVKARQAQVEAPRAAVVKVKKQRAGALALAEKGVAHVADVDGPVLIGPPQKLPGAGHGDPSCNDVAWV